MVSRSKTTVGRVVRIDQPSELTQNRGLVQRLFHRWVWLIGKLGGWRQAILPNAGRLLQSFLKDFLFHLKIGVTMKSGVGFTHTASTAQNQ